MPDRRASTALRRFAHRVSGRATAERIRELEQALKKMAAAQRKQTAAIESRLSELDRAMRRVPSAKDVHEVLQAVRALGASIDKTVEHSLAHGTTADRQRLDERRLLKRLDRLAESDGPILVGPWSGEVGFELLYWVPFVEWVRSRWGLSPGRQITVSRGGVASWYGVETAQYEDALGLFGVDAFRAATAQEARKQRRIAVFDRRLIDAACSRRGLTAAELIHPGLMYRMFMPYWRDEAGFASVERFARFRRMQPPLDPVLERLPREYVAVRFYFSECFPDTAANRAFVNSVVATVAERVSVVVLNPGVQVDDHADSQAGTGPRIFGLGALAPERNLAVQSAVIGRARAFIGTYGGYSYLAPFYGVPAIAFYSVPSFKLHHLHAAQRVFEQLGGPTVTPIDVADAPIVQFAVGGLAAVAEGSGRA
jgi:hypothetical protein